VPLTVAPASDYQNRTEEYSACVFFRAPSQLHEPFRGCPCDLLTWVPCHVSRACPQLRRMIAETNLNCGKKISGQLVIACGDGTKVLKFVEETLAKVALAIKCVIAIALHLPVGFRRNHRADAALLESVDQRIGIKSLIPDQGVGIGVLEQWFCTLEIVVLSRRQHQFARITQRISKSVDFGAQSAARSPDRLRTVFFRAPALCW
jgi:hypothetical protein